MRKQDDYLNVNGYLRQKMRENLSATLETLQQSRQNHAELAELEESLEAALAQAQALAEQLGAPLSPELPVEAREPLQTSSIDPTIRITLPKGIDYDHAFQQLAEKASEAGFTDVRPEQLLSSDEMLRAQDHAWTLDEDFARSTGITARDWGMVMITTAAMVTVGALSDLLLERKEGLSESIVPLELTADSGNHSTLKDTQKLSELVRTASRYIHAGDTVSQKLLQKGFGISSIRSESQILSGPVPFDIPDNALFKRADILGFDPLLGWLFGVLNILTDTVTTTGLNSYSVTLTDHGLPQADRERSTLLGVLFPAMEQGKKHGNALIAAALREADALQLTHSSYQDAARILGSVMYTEQVNHDIASYSPAFNPLAGLKYESILRELAIDSFLDLLAAAVCAALYDPKQDGDPALYSIRIQRILLLSNGLTALVNSAPALLAENYAELDWGGILLTCLNAFHSAHFWTEIKANYLVSSYRPVLEAELHRLDKYFISEN